MTSSSQMRLASASCRKELVRSGGDRRPRAVHEPRAGHTASSSRRLASLAGPAGGRTTPRARGSCSPRTATTRSCARCSSSSRARLEELEERDPAGDGRAGPERRQERDRRDRPGAGGDEAGLWAGDLYRMLHPLCRAPWDSRPSRSRSGTGRTRSPIKAATGRTRCSSSRGARTACSGSRRPSPRAASTPRRPRLRCFPRPRTSRSQIDPNDLQIDVIASPGRGSVGEHDRLGGADHPQAIGDRRLDAGREIAAPEPRARDARAAGAAVRARARRAAGRGGRRAPRRSGPASGPRRSAPTTTASAGSRTTGSTCVHNLDAILMGELDELTAALQDDEKRRRLEERAAV